MCIEHMREWDVLEHIREWDVFCEHNIQSTEIQNTPHSRCEPLTGTHIYTYMHEYIHSPKVFKTRPVSGTLMTGTELFLNIWTKLRYVSAYVCTYVCVYLCVVPNCS